MDLDVADVSSLTAIQTQLLRELSSATPQTSSRTSSGPLYVGIDIKPEKAEKEGSLSPISLGV